MRIQGKKKSVNVKIFLFVISICLVLSLFHKSGDARDSVNLGLVGKWGYQGAVSCVEIIEGSNPYYRYAYCGTEDGLLIIDVADPNLPKEEIYLGFGKVTTIRLYEPDYGANQYAILGVQKNSTLRYVNETLMETFYGQNGLVILDINDPIRPVYIGGYHSLEYLRDMAIIGNYAYVAEGENGLVIIDILDPTNPSYVGGYATKGEASGIEVAGNYAYVTDDENGLVIIDILDPIEPVYIGGYDTTSSGAWGYGDVVLAMDVAISGNYAYTANRDGGLVIVDIENPAQPFKAGAYDTSGHAINVEIAGNYAYVADAKNGMVVIDVTDPNQPSMAQTFDTDGSARDVAISGPHAYIADDLNGLVVIEIADPTNPAYVGGETGGAAWGIAISDHYAFVTDKSNGLAAIDITDPSDPYLAGQCDTEGKAYDVVISGDHAYVADEENGLVVIDVSNPSNPVYAGDYDTGRAFGIAVSEDYAYIADETNGLVVIDISIPSNPLLVGQHDTNGWARGVAVSGEYAYVADRKEGLVIIDISDPNEPARAGRYVTPGDPHGVAITGQYAYVADGNNGLVVLDISDPNEPLYAGGYKTPGFAQDVVIFDQYAYMANGMSGVAVVDISDPNAPVLAGRYDTNGSAYSLAIYENHAYVTDSDNGLLIFQIMDTPSPKGNVILCPSGPASTANALWPSSQALANLAYSIFRDRNYPDYFLYYISPNPYQDIDGDTLPDPLVVDDYDPSVADMDYALTDWAVNRVNMGPLYLYLPGLGTQNAYQVFPGEILMASDPYDPNDRDHLKYYLDIFQQETARDVICILEFLSSGSFCDGLLDPNTQPYSRTVITCTDSGLSYLDPEGKLSFTGRFFQLLQDANQSGLFSDTGISHRQRVALLQGLFSQARRMFWDSGHPFNTQPPQMVTSSGSHTLYEITLSIDPDLSSYTYTNPNQITLADPNHVISLKATGHYLDGDADITNLLHYHSSDPSILQVTPDGEVYANPNTNYNGRGFILATIIDPNFTQEPDHDPNTPSLGGITGEISIGVEIADRREKEELPKAIIIAGRLNDPAGYDYLWESTSRIATHAYNTFIDRGYSPENIFYLTHDPNQPGFDGPYLDDTFYKVLEEIFTNPDNPYLSLEGLTDLTIFCIDHGKKEKFILGPEDNQVLTPYTLNQWLDNLQEKYPSAEITVIIEACYSGGFLAPLIQEAENRIVITSTQETAAYLAANGWVSFTYFLLNYLKSGADYLDAFEKAHTDIASLSWGGIQHPVLEDREIASGKLLGGSFILSQGQPQILQVSEFHDPNTPISPHEPIELWARVTDLDGMESVWAVISNSQAGLHFSGSLEDPLMMVGLPKIDLEYNASNGRYEAIYEGFNYSGPHSILFLARDTTGMVSYPKVVHMNVEGFNQDYAFLIYDPNTTADYADFVEWVLEERRFPKDNIYRFEDMEGLHSQLASMVTSPPESLHHLILYFIYQDDLNTLDPNTLSDQLDEIQQDTNCTIITIMDADQSGRFLPILNRENRILISSTDPDHPSNLGDIGQPFSQFLFSSIYNGVDVNQAYHSARFAIGYFSTQNPLLDDNGNGIGLDYGYDYDGKLSGDVYLGSPFEPVAAGPRITLPEMYPIHDWDTFTATIWARILDPDPNSYVWALIIAPQGGITQIDLEYHPDHERFEADHAGFTEKGIYKVVVFFQEPEGLLDYDETVVLVPDVYEADDEVSQAKAIMVNKSPQEHNFHNPTDVDWTYFYAYKGLPYQVKAAKAWSDCHLMIEIFDPNGIPVAYSSPYVVGFSAPQNGFYFVRISYTCPALPSSYPSYHLFVVCPAAGYGGIWGWVRDKDTLEGIVGAEISTPYDGRTTSMHEWTDPGYTIKAGFYFMSGLHTPDVSGWLVITAEAAGYEPTSTKIRDYENNLLHVDFYLEMQGTPPSPPPPDQEELRLRVEYIQEGDTEIRVQVPLYKGLNLFSHPSATQSSVNAADNFLWTYETGFDSLTGPADFLGIRQYDMTCYFIPSNGQWSVEYSNAPYFTIASGESNIIYMMKDKTLEFSIPFPNQGIDLYEGMNYIGISSPPSGYTSYKMLKDMGNSEDVAGISGFDPITGRWLNTYWEFNRPSGDCFFIRPGAGYLVFMKKDKTWIPD